VYNSWQATRMMFSYNTNEAPQSVKAGLLKMILAAYRPNGSVPCKSWKTKTQRIIIICNYENKETNFVIEELRNIFLNGNRANGSRMYDTIRGIIQDKYGNDSLSSIVGKVMSELHKMQLLLLPTEEKKQKHYWKIDPDAEVIVLNRPELFMRPKVNPIEVLPTVCTKSKKRKEEKKVTELINEQKLSEDATKETKKKIKLPTYLYIVHKELEELWHENPNGVSVNELATFALRNELFKDRSVSYFASALSELKRSGAISKIIPRDSKIGRYLPEKDVEIVQAERTKKPIKKKNNATDNKKKKKSDKISSKSGKSDKKELFQKNHLEEPSGLVPAQSSALLDNNVQLAEQWTAGLLKDFNDEFGLFKERILLEFIKRFIVMMKEKIESLNPYDFVQILRPFIADDKLEIDKQGMDTFIAKLTTAIFR